MPKNAEPQTDPEAPRGRRQKDPKYTSTADQLDELVALGENLDEMRETVERLRGELDAAEANYNAAAAVVVSKRQELTDKIAGAFDTGNTGRVRQSK